MAPEIIHYFLPPLQAPLQCSSHTFNIKQIEDEKKADLTKVPMKLYISYKSY